jgi:hypothetical protein
MKIPGTAGRAREKNEPETNHRVTEGTEARKLRETRTGQKKKAREGRASLAFFL